MGQIDRAQEIGSSNFEVQKTFIDIYREYDFQGCLLVYTDLWSHKYTEEILYLYRMVLYHVIYLNWNMFLLKICPSGTFSEILPNFLGFESAKIFQRSFLTTCSFHPKINIFSHDTILCKFLFCD